MFDIGELKKLEDEKAKTREAIYEKVHTMCLNRIKQVSKNSNDSCAMFTVPAFVPGQAVFDISKCIDYICKKLVVHNIKTKVIKGKFILLDWSNVSVPKKPKPEDTTHNDSGGSRSKKDILYGLF